MEEEVEAAEEGATVSGSNTDAEGGVIGQRQREAIRQRQASGESISAIARELGLDRKTVRSCLRQSAWAPYRREVKRAGLMEPHLAWLAERAPRVNYSALILHQELRRDRGFSGCYEVVKMAVRPLRAAATLAGITQRTPSPTSADAASICFTTRCALRCWGPQSMPVGVGIA